MTDDVKPPGDPAMIREWRRAWFAADEQRRNGYALCSCCGLPNLGRRADADAKPARCPLCGWEDQQNGEAANSGYTLAEAQENTALRGHMFWPGGPAAAVMELLQPYRKHALYWLDRMRQHSPAWHLLDWPVVEALGHRLLDRWDGAMRGEIPDVDVLFIRCDSGWINFIVVAGDQGAEVAASATYDPFPGLLKWLEQVALGDTDTAFAVNEENGWVMFETSLAEGLGRLTISETPVYPESVSPGQKTTVLDVWTDLRSFALDFYRELRRFAENGYDPDHWDGRTTIGEEIARAEPGFNPADVLTMARDRVVDLVARFVPLDWICTVDLQNMPEPALRRMFMELLEDGRSNWEGCDMRTLRSEILEEARSR